jgi:hypothetical protein
MTRALLTALLFTTAANAAPPRNPNSRGLPGCIAQRDVCEADLAECDAAGAECDAMVDDLVGLVNDYETATPEGGGVVRSADGRATFLVPPGAVSRPTPLSIARAEDPTGAAALASEVYEIGPSGASFSERATVCLAASADPGGACLGFYDEGRGKWTCEDECLQEKGDHLCGTTDHLTNFALLLGSSSGGARCGDETSFAVSADGKASVAAPVRALPPGTALSIDTARPVVDTQRASNVYEIGPDGAALRAPATVCMAADLQRPDGACLGFIDESVSPPAWRCEDPCLSKDNRGQWCGTTSHFTNFAILLSGGATSEECRR